MTSPTYPEPTDPTAAPQYPPAPDATPVPQYPSTVDYTPAPEYPATVDYAQAPQYPPQYLPAQQYAPGPQYPAQAYPAGMPGQPIIVGVQMPIRPTSGAATASLVFGIVGILIGECLLGLPCLLAVIFGHIGLAQTKTGEKGGRGMAIAGLVLGYIVIIPAAILTFAVWGAILGSAASNQ